MANDKKIDSVSQSSSADGDLIPETDKVVARPTDTGDIKPARARKTPKPIVEGINSVVLATDEAVSAVALEPVEQPSASVETLQPQSTVIPPKITLTNSEKQLIQDPDTATFVGAPVEKPKVFPSSSTGQKISLPARASTARKIGWSLLISLLAVCLVFGVLLWYNNKTGGDLGQNFNLFPKRPSVSQNPPSVSQPDQAPVVTNPVPPPAPVATSTAPVATSTPPVKVNQVKISATPTGYLNVRSTPSTGGKLLTKVHPGEVYTYTQTKNGWYYIVLPDHTQGWITGQYATVVK